MLEASQDQRLALSWHSPLCNDIRGSVTLWCSETWQIISSARHLPHIRLHAKHFILPIDLHSHDFPGGWVISSRFFSLPHPKKTDPLEAEVMLSLKPLRGASRPGTFKGSP